MTLQELTPVPILQNEWEFKELTEIYRNLDAEKVIEIGSFFGATLYWWIQNLNIKGGHITAVDLPIGPEDGRYNQMVESRSKWNSWIEFDDVRLDDVQGNSTDPNIILKVHNLYPDKDVDFLFIDGDHSYEGVKADYENYHKLVRPGGMIVFHDIAGYWTVKKFWDEVKLGKKYKEICDSGPEGWGIGCLYV